MSCSTYQQAESVVNDLMLFGVKLGLDQMREFLALLGNPERDLKFIHIAGTNGKGSVAAMLSAALTAAGFRTGLYTSPHLVSIRERFRVDGEAVTEQDFIRVINRLEPAVEVMKAADRCPTYFEMTTAFALAYFEQETVDFVVWETGMGGRFDATNVVDPCCSVITGIGLDHQQYLGDSVEKIAFEKAGIIKAGKPVFCGQMSDGTLAVISKQAETVGAECVLADKDVRISGRHAFLDNNNRPMQTFTLNSTPVKLSLPGEYQSQNAVLAYRVLLYLAERYGFDLAGALPGWETMSWPARLQTLPDGSILDGAHNPQGIEMLVQYLQRHCSDETFTIIFANFADKNAFDSLRLLAPIAEQFFFVPVPASHRASFSGRELTEMVKANGIDIPTRTFGTVADAVQQPTTNRKVITGSLYLAGDALRCYYNDETIINRRFH